METRVGQIRAALGLKRPQFAALLGATTTSVFRWETDARWPEPRGLSGVVLNVIEERLQAGEVEQLQELATLATTDLQQAIRCLMTFTTTERQALRRLMRSKGPRRGRA